MLKWTCGKIIKEELRYEYVRGYVKVAKIKDKMMKSN